MNIDGKIGIYFLKEIWSHYNDLKQSKQPLQEVEWKYILAVFNTLGIGMEPSIKYLMNSQQSFDQFESWIEENGRISNKAISHFNSVIRNEKNEETHITKIFNDEEIDHWNEEGYVILKNAISQEDCKEAVKFICDQIDVDLHEKSSWYSDHYLRQGIMVQLFNHEILEKNRFSEKIRLAFEQLWNKKNLIVSMDRVSFNPPETDFYQFPGPNLHWDVSLSQPIPFGIQGLLYLTDTAENQGAFTLIPGFHKSIDTWLSSLDGNPRDINLLNNFNEKPISANAGDFIIWDHRLPHGSRKNLADSPRIVQYINYQPMDIEYQKEWI
ncbi:Phytanoyl-CoA dioxygenase (PhyH) [Tenacibaculum sp. MAR_2009_124]|uniref:phytanoyl-CoA dioxygenase family protein n=1 Tax=Tenacibaculum sp. MAR_2009_124 TaxID=1250059 RepID=UPI000898B220|nr:phytanoyl-CoA dioxygenase family protein [Tenacibaculum sp. MAR_2009_124]SEC18868.1 Phytanoyl-CoA dioxygenase (PhyH) [Tenacibaculum sp. MAR_2009_124]